MKPIRHFEREVRRARRISAWIRVQGSAVCECQVLDIAKHGAKVFVEAPSTVPDHFELAFFQGGQNRICEVVWRRSRMMGIKFIF
jgi:PilZ domain